ncbi:benzoate transporter [Oceanobacillus oncorhynchi subsp. incaldanensis]|uniref:benzoate/H(+) symporter BenE family transporter n=1 Tax=Oceanobacillus oncorhynchi TaxID=545501 RepID=UPI001B088BD2|nr:benzoate/H(+) symporter BenE family transporter [Oceanobacillus oncorhynchi]GIO19550.1 benzoate transporter [Oceanobacillus oncorhynchi subsp. incaldanensis]
MKSISDNLRNTPKYLNGKTFSTGVLAAIFGCTGPALIIIGGARDAGLTTEQMISWLFAVYFFGGLIGIYMALKYKQPIVGAYSIPGAVLVAAGLQSYSLNEISGAYLAAGIIVLILGLSGLIGKIMNWLPVPIVMAMIVGAMIKFGTDMIISIQGAPLIVGGAIIAYLLSSRLIPKLPPILIAFIVGCILAAFTGQFQMGEMQTSLALPQILMPVFNIEAIMSVGIPLALLVIGAENAQSIGVLMAEGYKPPINAMTVISGIGGIVTSFFGGHNANIAGPMTAICASEESGDKEGRYASVLINGILFGAFGLVAGVAVSFVVALPSVLVATVAGLAMVGVLVTSLQTAFTGKKFQIGAFFSLIIAMSGISFFGVSSPFWALIGGVLVSLILESKDFNVGTKNDEDDQEELSQVSI